MIPGTPIILGGKEYIVPPLTFPQAQELQQQLKLVLGSPTFVGTEGAIEACLDIIGTAIRRNYPSMTNDAIFPMLDFGNYIAVLRAVVGTPTPPGATFMMPTPGTLPN